MIQQPSVPPPANPPPLVKMPPPAPSQPPPNVQKPKQNYSSNPHNVTPDNPHPQIDGIYNIYADNVAEAFDELKDAADEISSIGVEAFFPGLVLRPTIPVDSFLEHNYATLRSNIDCTNLIQLDLTIRDPAIRRSERASGDKKS